MSIRIQFFVQLSVLIGALCIFASASPVARYDVPPKLSDTLAVAKSPLEPVTMAFSLQPAARNDELVGFETTRVEDFLEPHPQSTRSTQLTTEQESETTQTIGDSTGFDSSTTQTDSTTTQGLSESDSTTSSDDSSEDVSTTKADVEKQAATESPLPTTTTAPITTTTATPAVTTTRAPEPLVTEDTSSSSEEASEDRAATTTIKPIETTTTEAPKSSSTITTEPSVSESSPDTEAPSTTTTSGDVTKVQTESATAATETTTTTTTLAPTTTSTTLAPTTTSTTLAPTTTSSPTTTSIATTISENSPTTETSTTEAPQPSSVAPVSSTTVAPESNEDKKETSKEKEVAKEKEIKSSCNHLPTYNEEEIQKVFREETTFKNGTIKGKFTYINFDQRYRLVHYTRLPYGPVKVDLVEELGRPEQKGNQTSSSSGSNEVPNSVLQLRNILPNSLFGFPFLGPAAQANKPLSERKDGETDDKSNMYFYSTDSISTPNLLSPSVPVSVLPGQRKISQPINAPNLDTLSSQAYYENKQATSAQRFQEASASVDQKLKQSEKVAAGEPSPAYNTPHQFQYASAQAGSPEPTKQSGLLYTYLTPSQVQHHSQYQYSPVPLYSFHQPNYYSASRQPLAPVQQQQQTSIYSSNLGASSNPAPASFLNHHQTHQPHSHEHYVAPFMFAQSPIHSINDQPEASKLRVKVKTSKALNSQEIYGKSAHLRAPPTHETYSTPINSPVQVHRQHRQRVGKQNNELKPTINTSPVVYHVLRSPVGRVYSLPQYNQAYAMAYDHDN